MPIELNPSMRPQTMNVIPSLNAKTAQSVIVVLAALAVYEMFVAPAILKIRTA